MTRNSASAQIKALSMIIAIEGLISDRRAGSSERKPAPPPAAWLREQQGKTGPGPVGEEDVPGVPDPPLGEAADSSEFNRAPLRPADTTQQAPNGFVSASSPDNRVPSSTTKTPDTWRLRL